MQYKKVKKYIKKESDIENEILTWLNNQKNILAFKVETSGYWDQKKQFYRKRKSKFVLPGTSDILGVYEGKFFAIEVKREKNFKISNHQLHFINEIRKNGGFAGIARNIQEAALILNIDYEN